LPLYINNNKLLRALLAEVIKKLGHTPVQACNGKDAVELCKHVHFPLSILDYNMPMLNGLQVAEEIGSNFPFILYTSDFNNEKVLAKARSLGALAVVSKAEGIENLKAILKKHL